MAGEAPLSRLGHEVSVVLQPRCPSRYFQDTSRRERGPPASLVPRRGVDLVALRGAQDQPTVIGLRCRASSSVVGGSGVRHGSVHVTEAKRRRWFWTRSAMLRGDGTRSCLPARAGRSTAFPWSPTEAVARRERRRHQSRIPPRRGRGAPLVPGLEACPDGAHGRPGTCLGPLLPWEPCPSGGPCRDF